MQVRTSLAFGLKTAVFLIALAIAAEPPAKAAFCYTGSDCPDDGIACTSNQCQNNQCVYLTQNWKCPSDGQWCNGEEWCDPGQGGCVSTGSPCSPGQVCSEASDQCFQCDSNDDCDDHNPCTANVCSSSTGGSCTYPPITCNDGNACTTDTCSTTYGCLYTPMSCDDGNACTADACNAASGCTHAAVSCNDNNACTSDSCNTSTGCIHAQLNCNDGNACTTDSCNTSTGCVHTAVTCNDGLYCNGTETCNAASGCVAGANACAGRLCDETTDSCFECASGGPVTRNGLWFDGSNDYVRVGSPAALELPNAFTIEAWILPTSNTYGMIVNKESEYEIARFPDGTIRWAVNNSMPGWTWVSTGVVAPLDTWTHVAWTFDPQSSQKINTYINGVLVHSATALGTITNTPSPNDEFRIGNRLTGGNPFGGAIDEVRVWNVVRTAAQIQQSMSAVLTGTESGLKGYWRFEEGSGTTTADVASGNTATLAEAAWAVVGCNDTAFCNGVETCGANRLCTVSSVPCSAQLCNEATDQCYGCTVGGPATRNGLRFDGVNDVVTASASSALQVTTALTLEAWILPTADVEPGSGGLIAGKDSEFLFARNVNGTLKWALQTSSPGWVFVDTTAVAPIQAWSHVAFTYDGASVRTYLNGTLTSTQPASGAIQAGTSPGNLFRIGARYDPAAGTRFFSGVIDDVSLWSVALPAATIAVHAANGAVDLASPNLKGYWRLDEGGGGTSADAKLGNSATIAGALWVVDGCLDTVGCTADSCNASTAQCMHTANNAACNDANACTNDTCNASTGCSYSWVVCNDSNACTVDACTPASGCTFSTLSCDDGNACTADSCNATGGCAHTAISCDDHNSCTVDTCSMTTGCTHATLSCNDGIPCTADSCDAATGCRHEPKEALCGDGVACTRDRCDPAADGGCAHVADNALCDDGVGCNGTETCSVGIGCQPGLPNCDDDNSCTADSCDVGADQCRHVVDDSRCDDGIACTIDLCDSSGDGGCAHRAEHAQCDDGNDQTADACVGGIGCVSTLIPDDGNACTQDTCDPTTGVCSHTPIVCWDGDVCTANACDPTTGCSGGAVPCHDDAVYCNGEESCDPDKGCHSSGSPCLPGWECDESSRSCLSELWSGFWQVPAPDETCTMMLLPTAADPSMTDGDWMVEARCGGVVVGTGYVSSLNVLFADSYESLTLVPPEGLTSLTLYHVAAALTNQTNATRFVHGVVAEYMIQGETENWRELAVLAEVASLTLAASRDKADQLGEMTAASITGCPAPSPFPHSPADCDALRDACVDRVNREYLLLAATCAGTEISAANLCANTCVATPGPHCLATCGIPFAAALACWIRADVNRRDDLKKCSECDDWCHCEYFLERCSVTGEVGYRVIGLCPGEHVEMTTRCWRDNKELRRERDIRFDGGLYGSDILELNCPAGANWEVSSGPVTNSIDPQQPARTCTPQSPPNGAVAADSHNYPTFACFDPDDSETCEPANGPWKIKGLVTSDVPLPGGVFIHLSARGIEKDLYADPEGHPAFEFPPLETGAFFRLGTGPKIFGSSPDAKCYFEENHSNVLEGYMPNTVKEVLIHCTSKKGFTVKVAAEAYRGDPGRISVSFVPENDNLDGGFVYTWRDLTIGPVPDGTRYTLSVDPLTYNTNMECKWVNGEPSIAGEVHGPVKETLFCDCKVSPTEGDYCYPKEDDPREQDEWPWPPCTFCCDQSCRDYYDPNNCRPYICPCPEGAQGFCECCDVIAPPCPIACENGFSFSTLPTPERANMLEVSALAGDSVAPQSASSTSPQLGPGTVTTLRVPERPGGAPGNQLSADAFVDVSVDASGPSGISAIYLFVDHQFVDWVDFHTSLTSPISTGMRRLDTNLLEAGLHTLGVWAWDNQDAYNGPRYVEIEFQVDHTAPSSPCVGDTTPPSVQLTAPAPNASLAEGNVRVEASATDASGIARVEFLIDGTTPSSAFDTAAPYVYLGPLAPGQHTLRARAYDICDNPNLSDVITITVVEPDPCFSDVQAPGVVLLAPTQGSIFPVGGSVDVLADAQDPSGVERVAFFVDGHLVVRDHYEPFTMSQTFSIPGPHTIRGRAFDQCGNEAWSQEVSIEVSSNSSDCGADSTAPTVNIISPSAGATVPRGQVTIALDSTDNIGVAVAAFEIDGVVAADAVDLVAPFAYVFTTAKASYTLRAHVVDYCGNETWSSPVTMNVANRDPVASSDVATVARGSSVVVPVLANDIDPDGDPIHLAFNAIIVPPTNGAAVKNADGTILYSPNPGFPIGPSSGTDTFRYRIVDSYGGMYSAIVTVTVTP